MEADVGDGEGWARYAKGLIYPYNIPRKISRLRADFRPGHASPHVPTHNANPNPWAWQTVNH